MNIILINNITTILLRYYRQVAMKLARLIYAFTVTLVSHDVTMTLLWCFPWRRWTAPRGRACRPPPRHALPRWSRICKPGFLQFYNQSIHIYALQIKNQYICEQSMKIGQDLLEARYLVGLNLILGLHLTTMKVWRKWDLMQLGENLHKTVF